MEIKNLRERNAQALERAVWKNKEYKELKESVSSRLGIDITDDKAFPVMSPDFSWKKARAKLAEADSASSFAQLLRAGVQTMVNNMYMSVGTTFEEWAHTVASTKDTELYAPLQGIGFPSEVGRQEKFPEAGALGLDIKLVNRKYGEIFPVEKELLEDDQTGQVQKQVGLMAQYAKLVLEVLAYGKLGGIASTYASLKVPASETKPSSESSYPFSTALQGGGANKPNAFGALNQANIQAGIVALMAQKNLLGLKMMVNPDKILASPAYSFDLSVLLHSAYYPSGAAATGSTGGAFAINPIKGIATPVISRFMFDQNGAVTGNSKAWYLLDSSVPAFVVQVRNAAEVKQEDPAAGESFERDVVRWKLSLRANADWIDPRFAWQGSDGSV